MDADELEDTARALVAGDKGLLAMDESNPTCNRRFARLGIPQTEEARRAYRELIVTTPGLGECISGAILYDETIREQAGDGTPFVELLVRAGITPGIKVDRPARRRLSRRYSIERSAIVPPDAGNTRSRWSSDEDAPDRVGFGCPGPAGADKARLKPPPGGTAARMVSPACYTLGRCSW